MRTKIISVCISAVMVLCGCVADRTSVIDEANTVQVEMRVRYEGMTVVTRAADENAIADVNLYIFGKDNTSSLHLYSPSATFEFECLPGCYDVYAIADMHKDMGNLSARQLDAYTLTPSSSYESLPMTSHTEIDVTVDDASSTVIRNIEVKRSIAKITYNISVDESVSDIELYSVQAFNLPTRTMLFQDSASAASSNEYRTGDFVRIPAGDKFSGTFYMLENMQGTVPNIISQKDKIADNAPDNASFLIIRAIRGNKVLAYRVYLGENNTDDFNVRRNTFHTLDITVYGENDVDTRVSGYTVDVYDDAGDVNVGGYLIGECPLRISIDVNSESDTFDVFAVFEVTSGDASGVRIDDQPITGPYRMQIRNMKGKNDCLLTYCPTLYDGSNSLLEYRITVYDFGGFERRFEFGYEYANTAYFHIANDVGGRLSESGTLYSETTDGDIMSLCDDDGCSVLAVADSGYAFKGWYSDSRCTRLLSTSERYVYAPQSVAAHVYALFEYVDDKIFYTSSDGKIVMPFNHDAFPGNIVSNTYENGQGVMTFDLQVMNVGLEAFYNCTTLTSVTLPQCVRFIGKNAFKSCPLNEVTIPASVEHIGDRAFYFCKNLERVRFNGNKVRSVGEATFYNCTSLRSMDIPDNVESIGNWAFSFCEMLDDVRLPSSLTTIGDYAFQNCNSFRTVDIPHNVTTMGKSPFNGCISLEQVVCRPIVPPSIDVSYPPFDMCSHLKNIRVPASSSKAYRSLWSAYSSIMTTY